MIGTVAPYLALVALALVLMVPAIASPPLLHQSFWIDWVWADQFTDQLRHGILYPRWLPLSHGGLGSPVFYYYPPLAFYIAAFFGLGGMSTYASILAAFAIAIAASGAAMYHWLKGWTPHPLAGSLFFMAAPYHLLDFYGRGALAETVAIAFIPLVALGLKRGREGAGFVLSALAFAGLILAHLPLAVLAIVFLIGPYALFLARRDIKLLARLLAPFVVGSAIAGVYIVPALLLDRHRAAEQLWILSYLRADFWNVFTFDWSGLTLFQALIFATIFSTALAGAIVFVRGRSAWAAWTVVVCLVAAGCLPGFWSLPIIAKVQFPFRALPIAEFALATALALLPRRTAGIGILAVIPALVVSAFVALEDIHEGAAPLALLAARHPDVLEYVPPGTVPPGRTTAFDLVLADHLPRPRSSMTVAPTFFFPSWQVTCQGRVVETAADPETGLLSYRGKHCRRRIGVTAAERIGQTVSMIGLAILILFGRTGAIFRRVRAGRRG